MKTSSGLRAFICGCRDERLRPGERAFFREARPCGLILFKRNCRSPEQVRALVDSFRDAVGREDALVLIDQEGGRVQRLGPPVWRAYPPARAFDALYRRNPQTGLAAARACAELMGRELAALGINVDCAPVLDVPVPGAHDIIGDRAYGDTPVQVSAIGRAVAEGLLRAGVLPVIKHLPGHGRARVDSHKALPQIEADLDTLRLTDFAPFAALRDMPLGMTGHVVLTAVDPHRAVSVSPEAIRRIIRGEIGFEGLLMSDDIGMRALTGRAGRKAEAVLKAGCDVVLHCSGNRREMEAVAAVTPELHGNALARFHDARARIAPEPTFNADAAEGYLREALAVSA
ncbi:beta-N-acetylhexosaminidase [Dichotomicrobium thermohalophilum]|uniref:beta-N-acetylhexosaminidase n=1 Tax=Dichotomicrobium thermohalophilum TaxID=933063 RepID=A0A397QBQ6_9HYPH|nr:beta-N-acetylhexosaminidase [Dichotomicrobium thermohalophilum]RIA55661.1 beta-N-acetylhexosaminidase [Dichotomicrobium thermohalophilum]